MICLIVHKKYIYSSAVQVRVLSLAKIHMKLIKVQKLTITLTVRTVFDAMRSLFGGNV